MASLKSSNIYTWIETPLHGIGSVLITDWRDETSHKMIRKVVAGTALALLAIAGLVDVIVGLALGILFSPAELADYHFSRHFFKRSGYGIVYSSMMLTLLQYQNTVEERMSTK